MNDRSKDMDAQQEPRQEPRKIEIGWLLAHELSDADLETIQKARESMSAWLTEHFPRFDWRMPLVRRAGAVTQRFIEPSQLLVEGVVEREMRHWDFALVVTRGDLQSHYKPFALAVPSRAMGVAVISTVRLLPEQTEDVDAEAPPCRRVMLCRLRTLALHLLGDLNGLPHGDGEEDLMFEPASVKELDRMKNFSEQGGRQLEQELAKVGDLRLEERPASHKMGIAVFYLHALRIGWRDIASAIVQARPWEFPFRLSRLTTAALSALLILLMTAEVWDLGMNQSPGLVALLSVGSLGGTSIYVLNRQNLLLHRGRRRLTEQKVFANISTSIVVLLGMTTTYLLLFGLAMLLGQLLFPRALVESWAASLPQTVSLGHYFIQAGFVSSLGILIGALGASFEGTPYFRHICFVDEEI